MDFLKDLSIDKVRNLAEDAFNQAKPKTDVEARVYEVLSHKNWGASSTIMNQIAKDTYDYEKFAIVAQLMWEAMENQRPAAWRVVFKGLTLLEHLIKNGSERVVDDARNHGHSLRVLLKFNYYEGTVDRGHGVREKSKQIIEMLADDERVREERMKARQLREKFGSKLGAASNSGSGGKYSGYGNDGWSGDRGESYSEGGIGGSRAGGRYGEERAAYGGRYDEDPHDSRQSAEPQPTFAAIPDAKPKKSKKKAAAPAPAPEVDLFSFDDPVPTPAPASNNDSFGDFQSTNKAPANDMFASAPTPVASFNAFGGQQQQNDGFGAFASPPAAPQNNAQFNAFGQNNNSNAFVQQPKMAMSNSMRGSAPAPVDDDDFGDFADAGQSSAKPSGGPVDPMSKLISLDGLSKNTSMRQEDKLNQPVVASAAAASYLQEKDKIQENFNQAKKGSSMGFEGLDGLHKGGMSGMGGMGQMNMMQSSGSMGMNPNVMGSGNAKSLDMFAPSQIQPQQQRMNPGMQQQMSQMQGGMGMMNNMQQQGGMGFGNMQGNGMQGGMGMANNMQQQQMNFNAFQGSNGMQGGNNSQGNMNFGGF